MAQPSPVDIANGPEGHGLRFLNEEWNDSISNGQPFTLKWNLLVGRPGPQLGLFKVRYPQNGIVVFDLVSNLTGPVDSVSYEWTPNELGKDELYTVWLSDGQPDHPNWTVSPPWIAKVQEPKSGLHWGPSMTIPLVCILATYAICLSIHLWYRHRKGAKREQEDGDAIPHQDVSRKNLVKPTEPAISVESLAETKQDNGLKFKPSIWLIMPSRGTSSIMTEPTAADIPISRTSTSFV
ncbi:hypothetical protein E4U43_007014 [Claviceps pusilla]|uniref:Uncharacterized protein n=1 Tax=Claviceps pusilla TaxID=123648 RepID=A0A9P7SZF6_9HYPO|nr:hypothetical protein E4U43_007014 [Claviceps pusilla]